MEKKYQVLTLEIEKSGNLNLDKLSEMEKTKVLENRDIIYVYFGKKDLYIGQTINLLQRHQQHKLEIEFKMKNYTNLVLLYGTLIDKHLDYIEKSLINLFIADNDKGKDLKNKRTIRNKTMGNHSNYTTLEKDIDAEVLTPFWEKDLNELNLVNLNDLSEVKNSILFKYSPFFTLNKQQKEIIDRILSKDGNYLIEGGAGTGKTVLMTNLAAQIYKKYDGQKKIAVVVKSNWRRSGKKIFTSYGIKNVTVGTWCQIVSSQQKYDYILIDEAHRLPYKHGYQMACDLKIFKEKGVNHSLKLLGEMGKSLVLFYDEKQAIRPADTPIEYFQKYVENKKFHKFSLGTQFRISVNDKNKKYTADDYLKGIKYVLQLSEDNSFDKEVFNNPDKDSYFGLVDSIADLFKYIERMDNLIQDSQNRVIAGYAREWKSKTDPTQYDWVEGEKAWKWNSTNEDWMNTENSRKEIGSIHAVQGIDINCVGLIIGKDLIYRDGKVLVDSNEYFDKFGKPKKIKTEIADLNDLVKNIYYVLATRGIDGIRIYIEDKELRNHFMRTLGIKKMK